LLADDHSIVRRGLRGLLESAGVAVVAEAGDGLEAMRLCEEHRPELVILDISMPKLSGIEVAARAQKMERPPGVIILSVHGDESYIMRALAAGARAYLLKSATDEDLIPAVKAVAAGKPFFSPAVSEVLVEDYVRRLQQRTHRQLPPADRSGKGSAPAPRRGSIEQGGCEPARPRTVNGGDASGKPDAEAEPAQHSRNRALRSTEGADCLISHVDRMDGTAVSGSTEDMQTTGRVTTQEQRVMAPQAVPQAATCLVVVQRDWNGWRKAMAPVSALEDVHWHQPVGAPRPLIHAYVTCSALVSGDVPHECADGTPHRLLVCVLRQHTAPSVFEQLTRAADAVASR